MGRSSDEKARDRFPGAGINFWDDEDMPVICPTCQILLATPIPYRMKRRPDPELIGRLRHPRDLGRHAKQAVVVAVHAVEIEPASTTRHTEPASAALGPRRAARLRLVNAFAWPQPLRHQLCA
jgi:hypothetical protein